MPCALELAQGLTRSLIVTGSQRRASQTEERTCPPRRQYESAREFPQRFYRLTKAKQHNAQQFMCWLHDIRRTELERNGVLEPGRVAKQRQRRISLTTLELQHGAQLSIENLGDRGVGGIRVVNGLSTGLLQQLRMKLLRATTIQGAEA